MEFDQVIKKRRMVRAFTDQPLEPADVRRLLAAANRAPSAGFSQGYALLALQDSGALDSFWKLMTAGTDGSFWTRAPFVVVPMSCKQAYLDRYARPDKGWTDRDEARWPVPYWDIDTGFAVLLMLLAAVDAGLGALFFGISPELIPRFRQTFGVPGEYAPIGAVAVGHPDPASDPGGHSSRVIKRRSLDDLVHYERW